MRLDLAGVQPCPNSTPCRLIDLQIARAHREDDESLCRKRSYSGFSQTMSRLLYGGEIEEIVRTPCR